jgi:hypothetical protein
MRSLQARERGRQRVSRLRECGMICSKSTVAHFMGSHFRRSVSWGLRLRLYACACSAGWLNVSAQVLFGCGFGRAVSLCVLGASIVKKDRRQFLIDTKCAEWLQFQAGG